MCSGPCSGTRTPVPIEGSESAVGPVIGLMES